MRKGIRSLRALPTNLCSVSYQAQKIMMETLKPSAKSNNTLSIYFNFRQEQDFKQINRTVQTNYFLSCHKEANRRKQADYDALLIQALVNATLIKSNQTNYYKKTNEALLKIENQYLKISFDLFVFIDYLNRISRNLSRRDNSKQTNPNAHSSPSKKIQHEAQHPSQAVGGESKKLIPKPENPSPKTAKTKTENPKKIDQPNQPNKKGRGGKSQRGNNTRAKG